MLLNCGVGEDSSPLDCKEIQPVYPKGNQSWIFIGRPDAESWNSNTLANRCEELTPGKGSDAGKDWRQEEKGMTEDEMVEWHHWLNGHESEQAPGVGDGQGILACCSPWGRKELDMTKQLNWTELKQLSNDWDIFKLLLLLLFFIIIIIIIIYLALSLLVSLGKGSCLFGEWRRVRKLQELRAEPFWVLPVLCIKCRHGFVI